MPKMVFEFQYLHMANWGMFWNTEISATMENVPERHKYKLCSSDFLKVLPQRKAVCNNAWLIILYGKIVSIWNKAK